MLYIGAASTEGKHITLIILFISFFITVKAEIVETSVMGSYSKSRFAEGYLATQRRYSGAVDIKFTPVSAIQFEYAHITSKLSYSSTLGFLTSPTNVAINYVDQVYSVNWVQNLVPSKWLIQPYFKVGGGRVNKRQTNQYLGIIESTTQRVVTGTGGIGLRIFLTRSMALKGEFVTYVPDFRFSVWKDNQNFSGGLSWAF